MYSHLNNIIKLSIFLPECFLLNIVVNIMPSIISVIPKAQDDNTMGIIKMLVPDDFSL